MPYEESLYKSENLTIRLYGNLLCHEPHLSVMRVVEVANYVYLYEAHRLEGIYNAFRLWFSLMFTSVAGLVFPPHVNLQ